MMSGGGGGGGGLELLVRATAAAAICLGAHLLWRTIGSSKGSLRQRRRQELSVHLGGNDGGSSVKGFHFTDSHVADLRPLLDKLQEGDKVMSKVTLTFGRDPPPGTHMLVGSSPSREQLASIGASLEALVVPFAGVPPETLVLLQTMPGIKGRVRAWSLHHNAASTAELAIALLLAACKNLLPADALLRRNDWSARGLPNGGTPDGMPLMLLQGKTAVVVGFGEVGSRVAAVLAALGMSVIATRASCSQPHALRGFHFSGGSSPSSSSSSSSSSAVVVYPAAMLNDVLPKANVLILCVPQTADTEGMIGAEELSLLPPRAVLVNVGRGALVDEDALYDALKKGDRLASAGLDCWWRYPTELANRGSTAPSRRDFAGLHNCVLSPHRGGGVGMAEIEVARMESLASLIAAYAGGAGGLPREVDLSKGY